MVGDLFFVTSHCCEPATNLYGIDNFPYYLAWAGVFGMLLPSVREFSLTGANPLLILMGLF